jgi:thermitase
MGGQLVRWLAPIRVAQIRLPTTGNPTDAAQASTSQAKESQLRTLNDLYAQAQSNPLVRFVEFDGEVAGALVANDPDLNDPSKVYAPQRIQAPAAWDYTTGSQSVIIAIVDTGLTLNHPEFAGRVLPGYDFVNNDADPSDDHGHGTHVAGIAAAGVNNGIGMAGICGGCSVLPVKVLNHENSGSWAGVAAGVIYAADHGARIINLSLGGSGNSATMEQAVQYAQSKGVLIVAAAGNGRTDRPFYPAAYAGVLAVSATRRDDTRWSLSNYGSYIDVAAPGHSVYSAYHDLGNTYGGYTFMSGTSMASPHVAGLAGLLLSQDPSRTAADLERLITTTADDLGEPGWDPYFGYGRINALAALQAGAAGQTPTPTPTPTARMAGMVWHDDNRNGVWEESEVGRIGQVSINIFNEQGELVATTTSDDAGLWTLNELPAAAYSVRSMTPEGFSLTSQPEFTVTLEAGQQVDGLNFGAVEEEHVIRSYRVFVPSVVVTG